MRERQHWRQVGKSSRSISVFRFWRARATAITKIFAKLRNSSPCHCFTWRNVLIGTMNPGYGGNVRHILSKSCRQWCFLKNADVQFMIWSSIPSRKVWRISVRGRSYNSTLGKYHSAFCYGFTPSVSSTSSPSFMHLRTSQLSRIARVAACSSFKYSPLNLIGTIHRGHRFCLHNVSLHCSGKSAIQVWRIGKHRHIHPSAQSSYTLSLAVSLRLLRTKFNTLW